MDTISWQLPGLKIKKSHEYPSRQSFWYNIHGVHLVCDLSYSQKKCFLAPTLPKLKILIKILHVHHHGAQMVLLVYLWALLSLGLLTWTQVNKQAELPITVLDWLVAGPGEKSHQPLWFIVTGVSQGSGWVTGRHRWVTLSSMLSPLSATIPWRPIPGLFVKTSVNIISHHVSGHGDIENPITTISWLYQEHHHRHKSLISGHSDINKSIWEVHCYCPFKI